MTRGVPINTDDLFHSRLQTIAGGRKHSDFRGRYAFHAGCVRALAQLNRAQLAATTYKGVCRAPYALGDGSPGDLREVTALKLNAPDRREDECPPPCIEVANNQ